MAKKDDNNDEEGSAVAKEQEAKASSMVNHFARAKSSYGKNVGALSARQGERTASQAQRPMKDSPVDQFSAGPGVDPAMQGQSRPDTQTDKKDGDDDGDGDASGSSGKGGDSGGGPAQKPAPDSGYVSFADGATESKVDVKAKKQDQVEVEQAEKIKQEGPEMAKKADGPKQGAQANAAKTGPGKAGAAPAASAPGKSGGSGGGAAPAP